MKQASPVPRFFSELSEVPINPLVDEAQAQGRKAIGYTCSFVPEPLLNVKGIFGVRLRAPGVMGTPMADTYLSNVICSFTRSLLEFALEGTLESLDGWVFAASCDHMRRLYDNLDYLEPQDFIHILDVPHKRGDAAVKWMTEELRILGKKLSEHFHVDTGEESLKSAISEYNSYLELLRKIGELRKMDNPPITGAQFQTLLIAGQTSPVDIVKQHLEVFVEGLDSSKGVDDYRARLLLARSNCEDPAYIQVIEDTGGLVVGDRTCTGSIPALSPFEEGDDPYECLAKRALDNISCPRMMEEFDNRVKEIIDAAKEYKADGVVLETMKFCDTWGVEASPMVEAIREAGIPVLRLEREYALSSEGQLQTRIQAFLESMGK